VAMLVDGYMPAGSHMVSWRTNGQSSGTYLYRLRFGDFTETKAMALVK